MRSEKSLLFLSQASFTFSSFYSCKCSFCKTCSGSSWRFRSKTLFPSNARNLKGKRTTPVFYSQNSLSNGDNFTSPGNEYSSSRKENDSFGESTMSGAYNTSNNGGESKSNSQQDPTEEVPFGIGEAARRYNRKIRLYQLCASTDRGQMSRPEQRSEVEDLAAELESLNPTPNPLDGTKLDGSWELIYSSVPFYKTNPLLLASVTPFLRIDLEAFPGLMGTILQQTRVTPVGGERLEIVIDKTSLKGRSVANRLDLGGIQLDIPFGDILRRVQGSSSELFLDTYYLDDDLRISRTRGGRLLIFSRVK
ncbi:hypothetical protein Gasu2_33190 [Galdieria sulphuraria]|nr:hypothetical protein Gasu2_33190 [Galdieria sulphuraria]